VKPSDPAALAKALQEAAIAVEPTPDGGLVVSGVDAKKVADIALQAGVSLYGIEEEKVNLEQLYFSLTNGQYSATPVGHVAPPQVPFPAPQGNPPQQYQQTQYQQPMPPQQYGQPQYQQQTFPPLPPQYYQQSPQQYGPPPQDQGPQNYGGFGGGN
jgi:ABC-2 type transport system ATP-binding protein